MTSDQILTLLLAIVAASGTSLITGMFGRPRLRAEAGKFKSDGEVAVSGDAREWAKQFALQAQTAETRAGRAEERADAVEGLAERARLRAEHAEDRCDELETQVLAVSAYARVLRDQMLRHGWTNVPEPPPGIEPLIKG